MADAHAVPARGRERVRRHRAELSRGSEPPRRTWTAALGRQLLTGNEYFGRCAPNGVPLDSRWANDPFLMFRPD